MNTRRPATWGTIAGFAAVLVAASAAGTLFLLSKVMVAAGH
jgi:hypothetical protein